MAAKNISVHAGTLEFTGDEDLTDDDADGETDPECDSDSQPQQTPGAGPSTMTSFMEHRGNIQIAPRSNSSDAGISEHETLVESETDEPEQAFDYVSSDSDD